MTYFSRSRRISSGARAARFPEVAWEVLSVAVGKAGRQFIAWPSREFVLQVLGLNGVFRRTDEDSDSTAQNAVGLDV